MRTANDIAGWIVRYSANDLGVSVDPMSLEKLTYYSQAFHLALNERALFREDIQAWKWGPVIPSVYHRYKSYGSEPIVLPDEDQAQPLEASTEAFLVQVIGFFGQHTATNLSRATHLEEPWLDASREQINVIDEATLRSYYRSLMDEGERGLSRHELLDTIREPRWSSFYVAGLALRRMTLHPFYDALLAKKLAEPSSPRERLPGSFYAPVRGRDFVEFAPDEDVDDTIRRAGSTN